MSGIPSLVLLVPARAADVGRRSAANRDTLFHVAGSTLWARAGDVRRLPAVTGRLVVALYGARGQTMTYGDAFDSVFADDPDGGAALDLCPGVTWNGLRFILAGAAVKTVLTRQQFYHRHPRLAFGDYAGASS